MKQRIAIRLNKTVQVLASLGDPMALAHLRGSGIATQFWLYEGRIYSREAFSW